MGKNIFYFFGTLAVATAMSQLTIAQNVNQTSDIFSPTTTQMAALTNVQKPMNIIANSVNSSPIEQNNVTQDAIYSLAGNFAAFFAETSRAARSENLSSPETIATSIDHSSYYTRPEIIDGSKAFAAIVATRNQNFVFGISKMAQEVGANNLVQILKYNPSCVRNIDGYAEAKSYAANSLETVFNKIDTSSQTILQSSYDIQKYKWSQLPQDKERHLLEVDASLEKPLVYSDINGDMFNNSGSDKIIINDRIMASAVMMQLKDNSSALETLSLGSGKPCAKRAFLNVKMCLAASRYPYEHTYCLAKHAYSETNACSIEALK